MRARTVDAPTCCAGASECAHVRDRVGAHASAPQPCHALSRRRGPRVARVAGVLGCECVQREHRRVEHRRRHFVVLGMRRFRPGGA